MFSKYLNNNPVPWLLEESDPSIRYLTLRDVMQKENIEDEQKKILNSREITTLQKHGGGSFLGNKKSFDIYYKGTMWCFSEAVERGLDKKTGFVENAADFIVEKCQVGSGGFKLNWKSDIEVSCRTGDMIRYLIMAGFKGDNVDRGIKWIINNQRHDGGWLHCPISNVSDSIKLMLFNKPGCGLDREKNRDVKSCFYATIACSMALVHYKKINDYSENIKKASEFFLKSRMYLNSKNQLIKSKKFWNRDFTLLGYPVLSQYDILYGLIFISRAGYINDKRTMEAFNKIIEKQNSDGTWNLENAQTGMMFGDNHRGLINKRNKWVTLNVLRLLKYLD